MWIIMLISYAALSYIDTAAFTSLKEKGIKIFYIILMTMSYLIGTASLYISLPSPAEPIKNLILSLVGQ